MGQGWGGGAPPRTRPRAEGSRRAPGRVQGGMGEMFPRQGNVAPSATSGLIHQGVTKWGKARAPPAARRAPRCQRGKSRPPRGTASAVSSTPFARRRSGGGCRGGRQQREVVPRRACATDFAESGLSRDACARGASSGARRSPPRGRVAAGAATRTGSAPAMRRRASSRLGRARAEGQSACKRAVWRV